MKNKEYELDYYRMTGEEYRAGIKSFARRLLFHNLQFAYWFRRNQKKSSIISRFALYRLSRKYGLEISSKATIGNGLYLGHPYNITVGANVVMGNNVSLHKGCTLGMTNRGKSGSPVIGNNVYIGINATVVGNIHIGDDVLIAPNSYVNVDIPEHSIVLGNPATIHPCSNATEGYVNFCANEV